MRWMAWVAVVAKASVPVVALARVSPLTKPVTVPVKAGLAKPYWRVAAFAAMQWKKVGIVPVVIAAGLIGLLAGLS